MIERLLRPLASRRALGLGLAGALAIVVAIVFGAVGSATAQPATTGTTSAPPAAARPLPPGFERVAGAPETEKLDANPLVVGAYATIFIGMFGYIVFVARRQAAIATEMMALSERIRRAEKK